MKRVILLLILLIYFLDSFSQNVNPISPINGVAWSRGMTRNDSVNISYPDEDTLIVENSFPSQPKKGRTAWDNLGNPYTFDGVKWINQNSSFNGSRPITGSVFTGQTPGGTSLSDFLNNLFYPTQIPTSSLTVTYSETTSSQIILENMSSGLDLSVTLNWGAGRQASTNPLQSIVVNSVTQSFSQPSAPGTVSGTQAGLVVRNTDATFNNVVTATDSKVSSSSASVVFRTKWYYGFSTQINPSDEDIIALTSAFNTTRTKPPIAVANNTSRRLVIAFKETLDPGNISEIWVGGLNSTGAFTRTIRAFVNASGFSSTYIIYVQNTQTSAPINFEIK